MVKVESLRRLPHIYSLAVRHRQGEERNFFRCFSLPLSLSLIRYLLERLTIAREPTESSTR